MTQPRVLIVADECNPEWPSLPIVGYKYALEIAKLCNVTVATHVRNRENIRKAGDNLDVHYIDTEWLAAPMFKLARLIRGGEEVGWSTSMIFNYLPYLAFEHGVWKRFRPDLKNGGFDIVHRITPMSPTLPSWLAHRVPQPFVIGPLNGNLDWPAVFAAEQAREKEGLRSLRNYYKYLPYARSTYDDAAAVLSAFSHTRRDLARVEDARVISMPEIGFDPMLFHDQGARAAGQRGEKVNFLYAGRLVPYKLPELPIRAFAADPTLRAHHLHIVGDGPERARMEAVIAEEGLGDCITLHGRKSQADVADMMRQCDAFVFPSIRELGAGVVIEAMACGMQVMVANYGAPGDLAAEGRGTRVRMSALDDMVAGFAREMAAATQDRAAMAGIAAAGKAYADAHYPWAVKGAKTHALYAALLDGGPLPDLGY